jgi:predicted transcriptional regulator of viral defense system
MHDNSTVLDNLHERNLIAVPKTEQAMVWLVENGPLLVDPPIPGWIMERLVEGGRVMRLRRGVYLAPDQSGRLPSFARTMSLLDPGGYVTGHAALAAQGLNDQDISHWWAVGSRRQADIAYGLYRGHFVCSPASARLGKRHQVLVGVERVGMATPTQALVDEARLMPFGFDWIETARVLRNTVETGRTDEDRVLRALRSQPSLAATRRLGLLFEIVRGAPDERFVVAARRTLAPSMVKGSDQLDAKWRIALPFDLARIQRAIR